MTSRLGSEGEARWERTLRQANKQKFVLATNRQMMSMDFSDALLWEQLESDAELSYFPQAVTAEERVPGKTSRR